MALVTIGIMVDVTSTLIVVVINKYMQLEFLQGVVIIMSRKLAALVSRHQMLLMIVIGVYVLFLYPAQSLMSHRLNQAFMMGRLVIA